MYSVRFQDFYEKGLQTSLCSGQIALRRKSFFYPCSETCQQAQRNGTLQTFCSSSGMSSNTTLSYIGSGNWPFISSYAVFGCGLEVVFCLLLHTVCLIVAMTLFSRLHGSALACPESEQFPLFLAVHPPHALQQSQFIGTVTLYAAKPYTCRRVSDCLHRFLAKRFGP